MVIDTGYNLASREDVTIWWNKGYYTELGVLEQPRKARKN